MYPGVTRKQKTIQRRKVYTARNALLFKRIPPHPMMAVMTPRRLAMVERTSSALFPTRIMSARVQMLNQVKRHAISPINE